MVKQYLQCGRYRFPLMRKGGRPLVMGILNVTPDSFSDGGRFNSLESAVSRAEQMIYEGVDIIDIGGESSRPGALSLSLAEELRRVMPVVYALRDCGKPLSIDSCKPEVMREAIAAGVDMINDINGFKAIGALNAVKESNCALCIMHMQNAPVNMQIKPEYRNVTQEVINFLHQQVTIFEQEGVEHDRLCVDPGFGFGKTLDHNLTLLKSLEKICIEVNVPVLVGLSRKSMIGEITGTTIDERLAASVAAALVAVDRGASIVRVHDVRETVDALKIWQAVV